MNLWLKYVDEFILVAPFNKIETTNIDLSYAFDAIKIYGIPSLHF